MLVRSLVRRRPKTPKRWSFVAVAADSADVVAISAASFAFYEFLLGF